MTSLHPATREQTIYGPKTSKLSKNALGPNSGKYGRGRETTDIDRWKIRAHTISIRVNTDNVLTNCIGNFVNCKSSVRIYPLSVFTRIDPMCVYMHAWVYEYLAACTCVCMRA